MHETYCPNEYVIKLGEVGRAMYVISSGRLSVIGKTGQRFNVLRSGDYFGEVALIYSRKRTASVQSLTFSDLNILSYESFQHILDEYPEVVDVATESMGDRVVSMKNYKVERRADEAIGEEEASGQNDANVSAKNRASERFSESSQLHLSSLCTK